MLDFAGESPSKPVYGYPLEEHLLATRRKVAFPIELCVCALLELGMEEEGLFRIAGGKDIVATKVHGVMILSYCNVLGVLFKVDVYFHSKTQQTAVKCDQRLSKHSRTIHRRAVGPLAC
jgi:hypothetical protein